jgi:hypothetical protein
LIAFVIEYDFRMKGVVNPVLFDTGKENLNLVVSPKAKKPHINSRPVGPGRFVDIILSQKAYDEATCLYSKAPPKK